MDDIIVIDDFLTEEELDHLGSASTYKDHLWGVFLSFSKGLNYFTCNSQEFQEFDTSFLSKNLKDNEYFTSYLFNKIKKIFNQDYKLVDVYLNGKEALRNGSFHRDEDADRTVMLYITPWQPAWGGFTHFMKSEKEHVIIPPITKRAINFRSDILHKGYSFCNQNCPMRIVVVFKLKL
tara:strand:- start:167 stop:700 length:534 start_codon:yes stop_codon:yes gene_type:complete